MRLRSDWQVLRLITFCADAVAITLAFVVSSVYSAPQATAASSHLIVRHSGHIVIYVIGWLALLAIYRLYELEYLLDGLQQYVRIAQASTMGLLLLGLASLFDGSAVIARYWLLTSWLLSIVLLALTRFSLRNIVRRLHWRDQLRSRMLIVGAGEEGLAIAEQIATSWRNGAEVVGFLDEYSAIGQPVSNKGVVLGEPLALPRIAQQWGITDAIIVPQAISWESLRMLVQAGADECGVQRLWLAPAFRDLLTTGMEVHQRGSLPLLSVTGPRIIGLEAALKRGLDILLVVVMLPVALVVCVGITLWLVGVRHVTPIVRHEMVGRKRHGFTLFTFTPTPTLLRLHLWRLPTLFNVLTGELSLVGPRPIARSTGAEYRPWRLMLTSVRPGLTGPWWLLSGSGRRSVETEVSLDLAYIRSYSIWHDVRLLALTARSVLTRPGMTPAPAAPKERSRVVTPDPLHVPTGGQV